MDQIEKLFAALDPDTIKSILDQIDTYKNDSLGSDDETWCNQINSIGTEMIKSKE